MIRPRCPAQMRSGGESCRRGVFDIVMRFSEGIAHREENSKLGMVQKHLLGLFNPWRSKMLRFVGYLNSRTFELNS